VVHCLSLGAADYLIKPVDPPQLFYRVRRQLAIKGVSDKA
jgi:DNA-binding response OmpR family regulator